jgi:hypothetical protein
MEDEVSHEIVGFLYGTYVARPLAHFPQKVEKPGRQSVPDGADD